MNRDAAPYVGLAEHEWAEVIGRLETDEPALFGLLLRERMRTPPVGALRAHREAACTGEPAEIGDNGAIGRIATAVRAVAGTDSGHCHVRNARARCRGNGIATVAALRRAVAGRR